MMEQLRYPAHVSHGAADFSMLTGINGNRERLDSGTSGSSESSRGSGKPPRRRSHRPRGCRGGSNRRRNNAEKKNNANKGGLNTPSKRGFDGKARTDKKTLLTKKNDSLPGQFSELTHPALLRESSSTSISVTDISSSSTSCNAPSFIAMMPNDFATSIQRSFSDSSSEIIPNPEVLRGSTTANQENHILPPLPLTMFHIETTQSGPNPYALKLANHHNTKHHSNNANILIDHKVHGGFENLSKDRSARTYTAPTHHQYQCQSHTEYLPNTNGSFLHNFVTMNNSAQNSTSGMRPPLPRRSVKLERLSGDAIVNENNPTANHYHAERIEIQRQMVVGGSLFVTSPRSFLMGKRVASTASAF